MPTWETFQAFQNELFIAVAGKSVLDDDVVWRTFRITARQEVWPWSEDRQTIFISPADNEQQCSHKIKRQIHILKIQ